MSKGHPDCASGDLSSASPSVMGSAPQAIRYGHPCRYGDSGRGSQNILDLKQVKPITRHDNQALGANSECARAARAVLCTVSGHMIAPPGGSIKADRPTRATVTAIIAHAAPVGYTLHG